MDQTFPLSTNDFSLLSPRERSVVEGAVKGFTDEQIAQSLGISAATVNTYWGRIRAKLGSFSRTELATQYLRHDMAARYASLEAEVESLRAREDAIQASVARSEAALQRPGDERWRFLALSHVIVAAVVVEFSGAILYANPRARQLLRGTRQEIEGLPFWDVVTSEDGANCERHLREFFANKDDRRQAGGLDEPYYAHRRDDTLQRIILSAEWVESPDGILAVVLLREYDEEAARHFRALHAAASLR